MSEKIYFRPAIPLLISLIGGILLGAGLAGYGIWATAAAIASICLCFWKILHKKNALILPILFFVSLGYLSIQVWVSPRLPDNHILHYADSQRWNLSGRVTDGPQKIGHRTRFQLQVESLDSGDQPRAVYGKLRVTVVGDMPSLSAGDWVRLNSRIRPLRNFKNPGGFDYKQYMAFRGIRATAYTKGDSLTVVDRNPANGFRHIVEKARCSYANLIDRSGRSQAQGLLKALIVGDRSQISVETRQAFNRAGVGHLLAISGLHIGIVATVAFAFFYRLMTRFRLFLWRAWTRKGAALLAILPVLSYGMIAGFTPSTQRAVMMVAVFLLTFLIEREQDPLNTLALAAMVILVADPPSLFSISFQLSFTAVFAIICGFSWVQNQTAMSNLMKKGDRRSRFISRLVSFFLVSFFAICGTLPLVAGYFNQISLIGLFANFIMVPLVGFLAIPIGLVALFVSPLSATAALWCIHLDVAILTIALESVQFLADLPFAAVKTFTPSLFEIGCFYALCWALLNMRRQPPAATSKSPIDPVVPTVPDPGNLKISLSDRDSSPGRFQGVFRRLDIKALSRIRPAIAVLTLVLVALSADTGYWLYQRYGSPDLRITIIDVGHGSSSLLEFPGGYTLLIDGGGFTDNSAFDVGAAIVAPLLWRKKIRTVDALILSHPNSDHLNGLIFIARHFHVKKVWTNRETRKTLGYQSFMEVIANKKIVWPSFEDMQRNVSINGVKLDFLYPPRDFLARIGKEKWRNTNNNSLVVKVSIGSNSFLFPGDIMAAAEKELVDLAGEKLISTVLIAPHHGSRSSSSTDFLSKVNPKVVVISCGRQNRFKLPDPAILEKYQHRGYAVYRTDINGAIFMATDGQHLDVKPFVQF